MNASTLRSAAAFVIFVAGVATAQTGGGGKAKNPPRKPAPSALLGDDSAGNSKSPQPANANPKPTVPSHPAAAVEFSEDPLHIESLGLTVPLPVGCVAQIDTAADAVGARIAPKDAAWVIKVGGPKAAADAGVSQVADSAMRQLLTEAYGITPEELASRGPLIMREPELGQPPMQLCGHDAVRWYVHLPPVEGKQPNVRGLTVIKVAAGHFLTFELLSSESNFDKARGLFETLVAASTVKDPASIAAERAAIVGAGVKLLETVNEQVLREIAQAHPVRWERLYRPATNGNAASDQEIAYRRVQFKIGPRGLVNPKGPGSGVGDRQEGFIVQMDARAVKDGAIVDSRSAYFMSFDRKEESWLVQNAIRTGKDKPIVFTETGVRTDKKMLVQVEGDGKQPETIKPMIREEGYASQVEAAMMPWLIMRNDITTELGFYAYQSQIGSVRLRRDVAERLTDGPAEWKLTTRLSEDKPPQVSFFTREGALIHADLPDGTTWEPTTFEDLLKLWTSKGLPVN